MESSRDRFGLEGRSWMSSVGTSAGVRRRDDRIEELAMVAVVGRCMADDDDAAQ
jgi:hypothetical protein